MVRVAVPNVLITGGARDIGFVVEPANHGAIPRLRVEAGTGRDGAVVKGKARPGRCRPADAPEGVSEPGPAPWSEPGRAPGLVAVDPPPSPGRCPAQVRSRWRAAVPGGRSEGD